jgi:hypothetical protein
MPLTKFRSEEEARLALAAATWDSSLGARIARLWDFSARLAPFPPIRGVFRFRGIEEANRHRQERERERAQKLRQRIV